jgi:hypothetical protein
MGKCPGTNYFQTFGTLAHPNVDNTTYISPIFMQLAGLSTNVVLGFF